MAPKTIFNKEAVVNAAFELVRSEGWNRMTVRQVARKLGSSIAPVYSVFDSMDALEREVIGRAYALMLTFTAQRYTEMVFLNMGIGLCVFARDEGNLFKALFLEGGHIKSTIGNMLERLCDDMLRSPMVKDLPREERMALLTKMWTYTHGLATLICLGVTEDSSDAFIIGALGDVGRVVTEAALAGSGRHITE